jgi:TadE-like protein
LKRLRRQSNSGSSAIELLLGLPVLLILGLAGLQLGQWFSARLALNLAMEEAAQAGAANHALPEAIERGLARGLVPYLFGAQDINDFLVNLARAQIHVEQGKTMGWITVRQLSPTLQSFDDWAVPAVDSQMGEYISQAVEIPNDNLNLYSQNRNPRTGVASIVGKSPVGVQSGQTLVDANTLKLAISYGVALDLPIIGRLTASILRGLNGCNAESSSQLGLLELPNPAGTENDSANMCESLLLSPPRLPIRAQATIAMQTPARKSSLLLTKAQSVVNSGFAFAAGAVDKQAALPLLNSKSDGQTNIGLPVQQRPTGYLNFGAERDPNYTAPIEPGVCTDS